MSKKVIVIGGVAGGASAAARLRRLEKQTEIIILEKGEYISFANCGLPYYIGDVIKDIQNLLVETPTSMKEKKDIDVRIKHEVISIDRVNKKVLVKDLKQKETYSESYDQLVIATGSSPIVPPIPGIELPNIFTLWNIPDTKYIKDYLRNNNVKKVAVIGGGFIGIEMAENLKHLGLEVSIIEMAHQILGPLDVDVVEKLQEHIKEQGIELILGDGVKEFKKCDDSIRIITSDNKNINVDMVILSIGIKPNSQIAKESGIKVGKGGGIIVDQNLRTSDEYIYAAGDVIQIEDYVNKVPGMIPLAGPANKQGRIVANNIAGIEEEYTGTQGTSIVKVFNMNAASTGTNEKTLKKLGKQKEIDYNVITIDAMNHAGYYPNAQKIHIKIIFELPEGKILGAQIVGGEGVDKRIDIIATAIRFGAKMSDLKELELAYAPPFSSSKDPINILGYISEKYIL
ncbi:CoA-disulfide reductase [Alkalibaculum sp. M08DMB]|uniref:CoA-disulfide reductase n=1 Tax=Alkalibaculum sporogenes TaxID=2655001 RepID=A0A6A7K4L8_9FIRM|nr:FAD-dependent oxidoreductase [Alkalibaculum sporogenes]MPW24406.1 CoA-disulfide reductase [Alkalibaculum sporogenes]